MLIVLNGESTQIPEPASVSDLVQRLGLTEMRLAIEVNGEIAPRTGWTQHALSPMDRVEIVRAIGGG